MKVIQMNNEKLSLKYTNKINQYLKMNNNNF